MKLFFTLIIALAAAAHTAQAQTQIPGHAGFHQQIISYLLARQQPPAAQKTTAQQQRLIAQHHIGNNVPAPQEEDSVHYYYATDTRGSSFDLVNMYYDPVDADHPFFVHTTVQADSSGMWILDTAGTHFYCWRHFLYTPSGHIADCTIFFDAVPGAEQSMNYTYSYDAQDRLIQKMYQYDDSIPPVWQNRTRTFSLYDAQNNLVKDSTETYVGNGPWQPAFRFIYSYDANSSDLTGIRLDYAFTPGILDSVMRVINTYYPDHRLRTSLIKSPKNIGGALVPSSIDSFGYTGTNSFYTYMLQSSLDSAGNQSPVYLQVRTVNAQNRPDTITILTRNNVQQWEATWKQYCSYNSFANPVHLETYTITNGTPVFSSSYNFYYETYNISVANTLTPAHDVQIFPNPAGTALNLQWHNPAPQAMTTLRIMAMTGQTVYTETLRWNTDTQQIPVGHLQPGVYSISIAGQDGKTVYSGRFIKQ